MDAGRGTTAGRPRGGRRVARRQLNSDRSRSIRTERCRWQWNPHIPSAFNTKTSWEYMSWVRRKLYYETWNLDTFCTSVHEILWQIYHRVHGRTGSAWSCPDPLASLQFSHPRGTEARDRLRSGTPTERDWSLVRSAFRLTFSLYMYIVSAANRHAPPSSTVTMSSKFTPTMFQDLHEQVERPMRLQFMQGVDWNCWISPTWI